MKKKQKKNLSSKRLENLRKELGNDNRAEKYLETEKRKLIKNKDKLRIKIKKEKEILRLENRIKSVRKRSLP